MTADPSINPEDSEYLKRPDVTGYLKVREVLNAWDPIGIADSVADEYDAYVPEVVRMLDAGTGVEALMDWMDELAGGHMGLSWVDEGAMRKGAEELVAFWESLGNTSDSVGRPAD